MKGFTENGSGIFFKKGAEPGGPGDGSLPVESIGKITAGKLGTKSHRS